MYGATRMLYKNDAKLGTDTMQLSSTLSTILLNINKKTKSVKYSLLPRNMDTK